MSGCAGRNGVSWCGLSCWPEGNGTPHCPGDETCPEEPDDVNSPASPGRVPAGDAPAVSSRRSSAWGWPGRACAPLAAAPETGRAASPCGLCPDSVTCPPRNDSSWGAGCGPDAGAGLAGAKGEPPPNGGAEPAGDGPVPVAGGLNGDRAGGRGMPAAGGRPFGTGAPPCLGPVSLLRKPRSESMGGKPPWLTFQPRPFVVPISSSGTRREPSATIWVSLVSAGCARLPAGCCSSPSGGVPASAGWAESPSSSTWSASAPSSDWRWTGTGTPCDGQNRARPRDCRAFSELDVGSIDQDSRRKAARPAPAGDGDGG